MFSVRADGAGWDQVVDVRMILELAAPGVQDAGKAGQIGTEQARIARQLLEGLGRGLKQGVITWAFMGAEKAPQRLGHGEGEQEVGHGQLMGLLVEDPLTGFMLLALRTVAIAAGAMDEMFLTAIGTLIKGGA